MKASWNGHIEVVKLLLQNGANVNERVSENAKKRGDQLG
jgi:ankyrin repeat protein